MDSQERECKVKACLEAADIYAALATKEGVLPRPPYIAIGLFACELYMKGLLMMRSKEGRYAHTHNLHELFQALPMADQQKVENAYAAQCLEKSLCDFLSENAEGFEKWRYDFEKKEMEISHSELMAAIDAFRTNAK